MNLSGTGGEAVRPAETADQGRLRQRSSRSPETGRDHLTCCAGAAGCTLEQREHRHALAWSTSRYVPASPMKPAGAGRGASRSIGGIAARGGAPPGDERLQIADVAPGRRLDAPARGRGSRARRGAWGGQDAVLHSWGSGWDHAATWLSVTSLPEGSGSASRDHRRLAFCVSCPHTYKLQSLTYAEHESHHTPQHRYKLENWTKTTFLHIYRILDKPNRTQDQDLSTNRYTIQHFKPKLA